MKLKTIIFLLLSFFIYSCTCIFTKAASMQTFLSWKYILCVAGAVGVLGIFAILWQQIIKRISISDAYMFKGSSLIFTLILLNLIFSESITPNNIIGAVLIISGMTFFAKA